MKKTIDDLEISIYDDVYDPAEDSFLLAENVYIESNEKVLEVGSGTGYVSLYLIKKYPLAEYFSLDINFSASKCTKYNAYANSIELHIITSDLFSAMKNSIPIFDVIIFNSPYLPVLEQSDLAKAWSGGKEGLEIIRKFLINLSNYLKPDGRCYLVVSSYTNIQSMISIINDINYTYELVDTVIEGREKILLYLLKKK